MCVCVCACCVCVCVCVCVCDGVCMCVCMLCVCVCVCRGSMLCVLVPIGETSLSVSVHYQDTQLQDIADLNSQALDNARRFFRDQRLQGKC